MQDAENKESIVEGLKRPRILQFAAKLCVSITLTVVLLAAGECAAYRFMLHRRNPDRTEYRAYVVWRTIPSGKEMISVDREGWRRTLHSHCDANEFTIWMFGGSVLWGNLVRDEETIASLLAKKYEESGRNVCVRNFGESGWVSTQEVIQLMLELKHAQRKPDLVIFYDGTVDSRLPGESDEEDVHFSYPTFKDRFENWRGGSEGFAYFRDTNTYIAIQSLADKLAVGDERQPIPATKLAAMARRTLDNYTRNMNMVDRLAAQYGFAAVFFWEPWLLTDAKPLTASELSIKRQYQLTDPIPSQVVRATYGLFRSAPPPRLVNLSSIFKDSQETLYRDPNHLTPEGVQIVAERIFQSVQHLGR
jgi:lysophospholipase L1-like esterase